MPIDNEKPVPPSFYLDFASIAELTEALRSRKLSASELVEHTIARVEALDQRINAVVVRDFDRARDAARAADAALARGEQRPLLGIPVTLKEAFNVAGLPTTGGFSQFRDFVPAGRCAHRFALEAGGRHHHRQDQYPDRTSRFSELQRYLWNHQQPLGPRSLAGRLLGRISGGARGRIWPPFDRIGHRGIDTGTGTLLRCLRAQTEPRSDPDAWIWVAARVTGAGPRRSWRDRSDGALRLRSGAFARRGRRTRRGP
jgi:hypothetical protein